MICSRHCLIRRNGAGDTQLGEKRVFFAIRIFFWANDLSSRYCHADFILFATLVGILLLRIVLTYDIACQWSKNIKKRMEDFPPEMRIPDRTTVDVAIPSWHINGHGTTCRNNFNLSYMEGVGRTVGEDVETIWAGTNPLAPSIREMGPAARHDTLNDHWNGWNFRKIIGFGMNLLSCSYNLLTFTFSKENCSRNALMRHSRRVPSRVRYFSNYRRHFHPKQSQIGKQWLRPGM